MQLSILRVKYKENSDDLKNVLTARIYLKKIFPFLLLAITHPILRSDIKLRKYFVKILQFLSDQKNILPISTTGMDSKYLPI